MFYSRVTYVSYTSTFSTQTSSLARPFPSLKHFRRLVRSFTIKTQARPLISKHIHTQVFDEDEDLLDEEIEVSARGVRTDPCIVRVRVYCNQSNGKSAGTDIDSYYVRPSPPPFLFHMPDVQRLEKASTGSLMIWSVFNLIACPFGWPCGWMGLFYSIRAKNDGLGTSVTSYCAI